MYWSADVDLTELSYSRSHVDTVINDVGGALCFTGFYGQPDSSKHKES